MLHYAWAEDGVLLSSSTVLLGSTISVKHNRAIGRQHVVMTTDCVARIVSRRIGQPEARVGEGYGREKLKHMRMLLHCGTERQINPPAPLALLDTG